MKRTTVIGAAGVLAAAALLVVPGATMASFSDRASGPFHAMGATTLEVDTGGGTGADHLDFSFDNLLPGVPQTAGGTYRNAGAMAQDVWIVFNDAAALGALNDLGGEGEVHVASNGTEIFASHNLDDHALPQALELAANAVPGAVGSFTFGFNYRAGLSVDPAAFGLPFQIVATQPGIAP